MSSNQLPPLNLVVQNGPHRGRVFAVKDRPQTIGRGSSNDIIISHQSLSRLHARIRATSHGFVIEDLGSTNGTFVNQARITGPAPIRPGDVIRLGTTIIIKAQLGQAGAGGSVDDDETITPAAASKMGNLDRTLVSDATVVPGATLGKADYTVSPAPVAPTRPQQPNRAAWLWVGLVVIVAMFIVGGALGYLYYATLPQTSSPAELAQPPTLTPTDTPKPTTTPTSEPSPEPTSTLEPLNVPGVPVASVPELTAPSDIINQVDPFCQGEIEVSAEESVYIKWEQRLARADGETDYLTEWLTSAYYDITLDGRRINSFNYYRGEDPSLNLWSNLGILQPGTHIVRVERYTSRQISSGLDIEPADGQVDVFGPGPAGEGFCEIVVPEPIAAAPSTPTSTPVPTPTLTPKKPTPTPTTKPQISTNPAPLGIFQDFESQSSWKRGDQPYGEFNRSSSQVHSGSYAGQLSYNFPTPDNDYVVFMQSRRLAGQPNAISAWVYGDGAGHFLNIWLKDANGQTWGMSFGQVKHTGWQEMTAYIDPSQPWPNGHISGPDNKIIDYPISFQALALDDGSDDYSGRGVIYIDDLNSQEGSAASIPTPKPGTPTTATGQPTPATVISGDYSLVMGSKHVYEEPWGGARGGDVCKTYRENSWDDKNPNFRGFNIELLLTNRSQIPVAEDWGGVDYITAAGKSGHMCYHNYPGSGPQPGTSSSVTWFALVDKGDYVRVIQLPNVNGQFLQICLDPSGAHGPC